MESANPMEELIGRERTARLAGLSLLDLDSMTVRELRRHGLTAAQARRVKAAFEMGRQLLEAEACLHGNAPTLSTPEEAYRYMRPRYVNEYREHFDVLMMDNRNRLIRHHRVSTGSLTASVVHPRECFNPVIRESAAGVIFSHNHPSGDPLAFARGRGDHPPAPAGGRGDGGPGPRPRGLRARPFLQFQQGGPAVTFRCWPCRRFHMEGCERVHTAGLSPAGWERPPYPGASTHSRRKTSMLDAHTAPDTSVRIPVPPARFRPSQPPRIAPAFRR